MLATNRKAQQLACACLTMLFPLGSGAQIRVHPVSVSVSSQGASTSFLSYGGLRPDQSPSGAVWCGRLMPAAPDIGFKCDPAALWGQLPTRFDWSQASGVRGYTDIMSIPPSIARRAYASAARGDVSTFFYVRRFVSNQGLPDEYITVVCLLAGGGANVPLSLTDVRLGFASDAPVQFVRAGVTPPPVTAKIRYSGSGRLIGRWEVVRPGEELPTADDLLTEASLPLEQRGLQRRYTELERFNVFLPPTGATELTGPDPSWFPADAEGTYLVLLRIEASDDAAGASDLGQVGEGTAVLRTGAVAGFPLPTLRYVVGAGESDLPPSPNERAVRLLLPRDQSSLGSGARIQFTWVEVAGASYHRLEVERAGGEPVHAAMLTGRTDTYVAPPWLVERAQGGSLRWRVRAFTSSGRSLATSEWRSLSPG
jgi:hypothetical protein